MQASGEKGIFFKLGEVVVLFKVFSNGNFDFPPQKGKIFLSTFSKKRGGCFILEISSHNVCKNNIKTLFCY